MNDLKNIHIWGGGLIGYTLAQAFADKGISVTILDIDGPLIVNIKEGKLPRVELNELVRDPSGAHKKHITALHVDDFQAPQDSAIHFLSVPTEKEGETFYEPIRNAVSKIVHQSNKDYPVYLIAESTISPNWFSDIHAAFDQQGWVHGKNYHIGASPRRDVFNSDNLRMQNLAKIIGGDSLEIIDLMKKIYEGIAGDIHVARDCKHAMLVKIVENFLRDTTLNIVNGLATAFPDYDMVDVFELASTKWNIERYHPSLGIGGYCIPLAKKYMADAANGMGKLEKAIEFNAEGKSQLHMLETVIKNRGVKSVAVLGLSYGPSFKVHTRSPTLELVKRLKPAVVNIAIHDPFYTGKEITGLTGCPALENLEDLRAYDTVVLVTAHPYYHAQKDLIVKIVRETGSLLVDNLGAFKDGIPQNTNYWEVGTQIPNQNR